MVHSEEECRAKHLQKDVLLVQGIVIKWLKEEYYSSGSYASSYKKVLAKKDFEMLNCLSARLLKTVFEGKRV